MDGLPSTAPLVGVVENDVQALATHTPVLVVVLFDGHSQQATVLVFERAAANDDATRTLEQTCATRPWPCMDVACDDCAQRFGRSWAECTRKGQEQ